MSELGITADEESINELISSAFVEYATNPMLVKGWVRKKCATSVQCAVCSYLG